MVKLEVKKSNGLVWIQFCCTMNSFSRTNLSLHAMFYRLCSSVSPVHACTGKKSSQPRDSVKLHIVRQLPSQYLSSWRFWYGVDKQNLADLLIRGYPLRNMVHDLSLGDLASWLLDNKRYRYLPCLLVRIPANAVKLSFLPRTLQMTTEQSEHTCVTASRQSLLQWVVAIQI